MRSADLHRAGYDREAKRLLEDLLDQDPRCIDAYVHLGLIAFDTKGPTAALPLYEAGVAVGEEALPEGFGGVLPWGLVDNRPFLRALHGLGLCAWRQRRWEDAERAFMTRAWLDPGHEPRAPGSRPFASSVAVVDSASAASSSHATRNAAPA